MNGRKIGIVSKQVTFSYYDDGRLQQSVDPTGTIIYAYDARGRLQTVSEDTATLTRVYDMLDRVTGMSQPLLKQEMVS